MFKSLTQKLLLSVLLLGLGLLVACTGPTGPAGANGSPTCQTCHTTTNDSTNKFINTKWNQFAASAHGGDQLYISEGGRPTTCGVCHNGDGFVEAVTNKALDATTNSVAPITCKTCHTIHTKYDVSDFALRLSTAFQCRVDTSKTMDFQGNANTCAKCHQLRVYTRLKSSVDKTKDSIFISNSSVITTNGGYTTRGPHYGLAASWMTGYGIEKWNANANAGSGFDPSQYTGEHTSLKNSCVACHMSADTTSNYNGGHTFKNPATGIAKISAAAFTNAGCLPACHAQSTLGTGAIYKSMTTDLAAMAALLVKNKMINEVSETNTSLAPATGSTSLLGVSYQLANKGANLVGSDTISAMYTFLNLYKDRSYGAHNPKMMRAAMDALKNFFK